MYTLRSKVLRDGMIPHAELLQQIRKLLDIVEAAVLVHGTGESLDLEMLKRRSGTMK